MINTARGEVALRIGGEMRALCLTMGALARLEQAFGAADLAALGARLRTMTQDDLRVLLEALLDRPADVRGLDWSEAAKASAECFRMAFTSRS